MASVSELFDVPAERFQRLFPQPKGEGEHGGEGEGGQDSIFSGAEDSVYFPQCVYSKPLAAPRSPSPAL